MSVIFEVVHYFAHRSKFKIDQDRKIAYVVRKNVQIGPLFQGPTVCHMSKEIPPCKTSISVYSREKKPFQNTPYGVGGDLRVGEGLLKIVLEFGSKDVVES